MDELLTLILELAHALVQERFSAPPVDPYAIAKALGIKVYTIGAGRPGQVPVPTQSLFGRSQITYQESVLDEETLQQVAEVTGGQYFRAEDTEGLREIYDAINNMEQSHVEIEVYNQYFELAGYLLVPALLILLAEMILRNTTFRKIP